MGENVRKFIVGLVAFFDVVFILWFFKWIIEAPNDLSSMGILDKLFIVLGIGLIIVGPLLLLGYYVAGKGNNYAKIRSLLGKNGSAVSYNYDIMDGVAFERTCKSLLIANGYSNPRLTKASGDFGVDILCEKNGKRYAIQCKRYSSNVGIQAVQQVESGCRYYGCNIAVVMTNRHFTEAARRLAEKTGVMLWDRNTLKSLERAQTQGKTLKEAKTIAKEYEKLFKKSFHRDVGVVLYTTNLSFVQIEYCLMGEVDDLEQFIEKMNSKIGYQHSIEWDEETCKLIVSK